MTGTTDIVSGAPVQKSVTVRADVEACRTRALTVSDVRRLLELDTRFQVPRSVLAPRLEP